MKNFLVRASSALVAVVLIALIFHFLQIDGLRLLVHFAVLLGGVELIQLLFRKSSLNLKVIAYFLTFAVHLGISLHPALGLGFLGLAFVLFACVVLCLGHRTVELPELISQISAGAVSFVYLGLLPSFAYLILGQEQALTWFLFLLCVVFAGDIGAYLAGVTLGKTKVMPRISPKKSLQGSIGGLLASALVAAAFSSLVSVPPLVLALLGLSMGFIAQLGDFFESLLKRAVDAKDSGRLMPGHGGILDRIDGVLFACPVLYCFLAQSLVPFIG